MATTLATKKRKRKSISYIQDKDPNGHYVSIAEYIRLRHESDIKKDPTASPLYHSIILKQINAGLIPVYQEGKNKFIDWNISGGFLFKRNFQMPVPQKKKKV